MMLTLEQVHLHRRQRLVQELTLHESQDLLILLFGLTLFHQVDFILQDQDVLQLHDLDSGQMF